MAKQNSWETERIPVENEDTQAKRDKCEDTRNPFELDKTRVVHSFTFRRLQGKFQMISGTETDFNRNRLTHSLEVASIAKNIYLKLQKKNNCNEYGKLFQQENIMETVALLETISLLHDIGNPPFGHAGEVALNCMMHDHGGCEGNAQALHLLTRFGEYLPEGEKFHLSKRTLLGILKYPAPFEIFQSKKDMVKPVKNRMINHNDWKPPKCYYDCDRKIVNKLLKKLTGNQQTIFCETIVKTDSNSNYTNETTHKTFDCSIMDLADDISNAVHDLEDSIYLKLINKGKLMDEVNDRFPKKELTRTNLNEYLKNLNHDSAQNSDVFDSLALKLFGNKSEFKSAIGDLIRLFVVNADIDPISDMANCKHDIFKYNVTLPKELKQLIEFFKDLVMEKVIKSDQVQSIVHGGMLVTMQIFEAIASNPEDLLSKDWYKIYQKAENKNRVICNFVAGMTDSYAYRMHARLYGHNTRNMFEIL